MPIATGVTINGLDLNVTYGIVIGSFSGWAGVTELAYPSLSIPGEPGEILIGPYSERPRRIGLRGWIVGTSIADARTKLDTFQTALVIGQSVQLSFQDYSTRALTARIVDINVDGGNAVLVARKIPVTMDFVAHDPFWYDTSAQNIAANTAMPLGSAPTRPLVTLTATGVVTNPTLNFRKNDGTLISAMGITVGLVNTDTLAIDHKLKTIKKNGVSILGSLTSGDFIIADPALHLVAGVGPKFDVVTNTTMSIAYNRAWR